MAQAKTQSDPTPLSSPDPDGLRFLYGEVCRSYHAITDFRAKLLALLPITSGVGIFLLLDTEMASAIDDKLLPIGIFGFVVTIGLGLYELEGNRKCVALEAVGEELERALSPWHPLDQSPIGQFHSKFRSTFKGPRPADMHPWLYGMPRFVGAGGAGGVIYLMVIFAWLYVIVDSVR